MKSPLSMRSKRTLTRFISFSFLLDANAAFSPSSHWKGFFFFRRRRKKMMISESDIHLPKASNQISHAIFSCHLLRRNICIDRNTPNLSLSSLCPYRKSNWSSSSSTSSFFLLRLETMKKRERKKSFSRLSMLEPGDKTRSRKRKRRIFLSRNIHFVKVFSSRTMHV